MDILKTIGIGIAGVVVGLLLGANMGGGALQGVYEITTQNFTTVATEDITVSDDATFGSSSATTSVNLGRMCATVYEYDGTATYWYVSTTGSLATSSTSCN